MRDYIGDIIGGLCLVAIFYLAIIFLPLLAG